MSYASLMTEAADLALSIKAKAEQLYKAATAGTPTPIKVNASIANRELRHLSRLYGRVMDNIEILELEAQAADVARNTQLDAERARLTAEAETDISGRVARYAAADRVAA